MYFNGINVVHLSRRELIEGGIYKMLKLINDLPVHVLGVHAQGEVQKTDLDHILKPGFKSMVEKYGKINYLLILETDVKKFSTGFWVADTELGLKYFFNWNKIAIVTDQPVIRKMSNFLGYLIPGKSQGFSLDHLDKAVKWISEK